MITSRRREEYLPQIPKCMLIYKKGSKTFVYLKSGDQVDLASLDDINRIITFTNVGKAYAYLQAGTHIPENTIAVTYDTNLFLTYATKLATDMRSFAMNVLSYIRNKMIFLDHKYMCNLYDKLKPIADRLYLTKYFEDILATTIRVSDLGTVEYTDKFLDRLITTYRNASASDQLFKNMVTMPGSIQYHDIVAQAYMNRQAMLRDATIRGQRVHGIIEGVRSISYSHVPEPPKYPRIDEVIVNETKEAVTLRFKDGAYVSVKYEHVPGQSYSFNVNTGVVYAYLKHIKGTKYLLDLFNVHAYPYNIALGIAYSLSGFDSIQGFQNYIDRKIGKAKVVK